MDLSKAIGDAIRSAVRSCGNIRNLGSCVETELRDVLKDVIAFPKVKKTDIDLCYKDFESKLFLIYDKYHKHYFVFTYLDLIYHITDDSVYFEHYDVYVLSEY